MAHIWIIGASHGIGAALAKHLALEGHHLAISGRDAGALDTIRNAFPQGHHHVIPLDATDDSAFPKAIGHLNKHWPRIDRVIYNAGISPNVDQGRFDPATLRSVLAVNLIGAFACVSSLLETWKKQGGGHLVLVGSVAGYRGLPMALSYCASKAAIISLAESLAIDLHPLNVKVQICNPGFVKTRMTDKNDFPMPMMISPEEAAFAFARGMESDRFEISFPRFFTFLMKQVTRIPYPVYFYIMRRFSRGR